MDSATKTRAIRKPRINALIVPTTTEAIITHKPKASAKATAKPKEDLATTKPKATTRKPQIPNKGETYILIYYRKKNEMP